MKFSGSLAATERDLQRKCNFICAGSVAFAAGAAAGVAAAVCAFIPGPGWIVAAIIAAAVIAGLIIAGGKCAAAAATRYWDSSTVSQRSKLNGAHLLTLSSQMICPAQGGVITAEPTFWSAWGTQTLTNLGHVSNFAFGFLVGKGCANMAIGAGSAAAGASTAGEAVTTFGKTFAKDFAMTAKDNFVQQFTGWNQGGLFCRFMKGFGLYGQAKEHYDIWTDDEKSTWEKIKESGMSLILDVFAAKGATTVCFPAGTKVHTQWGLADIEKLEVGVPVLTYNEETGEQEYKKVKKVMRRMTRRMCAMELSNGTTLEVTPEHRFFSNGEWTPIEELNVNDNLQLKDNSIVVIENKIIFPTFVEVYNMEIEDNENYYVTEQGVLVHNGYKDKPKNSPDPKRWKENGGTIKVSDDGKVWEYTDWEGNTVKYKDGYPDFSPHERQHVDIDMKGNRTSDFTEANKKAPKGKKLPENTWHHNENGTTMQEVPTDIHRRFTHRGGVSILKNN
nr:polymorphic toxin-type HINT domain-containing protein [uncultured Prevotella sp.]